MALYAAIASYEELGTTYATTGRTYGGIYTYEDSGTAYNDSGHLYQGLVTYNDSTLIYEKPLQEYMGFAQFYWAGNYYPMYGNSESSIASEFNRLASNAIYPLRTAYLDIVGAANAWAGTSGLGILAALNIKADPTGIIYLYNDPSITYENPRLRYHFMPRQSNEYKGFNAVLCEIAGMPSDVPPIIALRGIEK